MDVYMENMKVKGSFVYCNLKNMEGDLIISATIDYCISAAKEHKYNIINSQQALEFLLKEGRI